MDQYIMEAVLGPMMLLGAFGNLNVIVAVARKKVLRTKGAMLVFVLAISHFICNVSELKVLIFRLRFQSLTGRECFLYNVPYSFCVMFQSALFLSMALDLCFCIMLPIKHMLWPKKKYILIMCIMPTCFALIVFFLNFLFVTDENAPYCAFMLIRSPKKEVVNDSAMDDGVFEIISTSVVVCNIITFIITVVSVIVAIKKSQDMRNHRHSIVTRRNSTVEERRKNEQDIAPYMPFLAIITMPNFCQAYFVTYFRSPRFRKAYREHFHWLTCGCLYRDIMDQPETRAGESGSKPDSATNQQPPTETVVEKKQKDGGVKKTVRIYEGEAI
ncbi:hypothetical protein GCK72_018675 [Caenorhabditis remanei]|uniref:G-protein coupled receptors family 1 profile domain-containing protein n=1 Tax=Caenorhabditis remanei TaxID=31234 RepID=A0A6A5GBM3_CAERE|nr:hypothetical protein GCK72_018675 [Caenorhabditis remanei]KAF1752121.1 hypothetical protein GCK72_018675 [Caenorhabditis remanei]